MQLLATQVEETVLKPYVLRIFLIAEYRHFPVEPGWLKTQLSRLTALHSTATVARWIAQIDAGAWDGMVGDLLATQAKVHGAAAILVNASVRDVEELAELGLPIWARWVRVRGAAKAVAGAIGEPVVVAGATIRQGDVLVLDADGVAVVESERVQEVLEASRERAEREVVKRAKLQQGALSYDLDGLSEKVEA